MNSYEQDAFFLKMIGLNGVFAISGMSIVVPYHAFVLLGLPRSLTPKVCFSTNILVARMFWVRFYLEHCV